MKSLKHIEPFGYIQIPKLSDQELTATYEAAKWVELAKPWKISMYLTNPETKEPLEMASVTLSIGTKDYKRESKIR